MSKAILTVGYPSSGKSIVLNVAEDMGLNTISMGDIVRKKAQEMWSDKLKEIKQNPEKSNETISELYARFATQKRQEHGKNIIARWCMDYISDSEDIVFLDGIRSPEGVEYIKKHMECHVIFVYAPANNRYHWMLDRGREYEDSFTPADFINRDKQESNWGIDLVIEDSNYILKNCSTIEDLEKKSNELLLDIIHS